MKWEAVARHLQLASARENECYVHDAQYPGFAERGKMHKLLAELYFTLSLAIRSGLDADDCCLDLPPEQCANVPVGQCDGQKQ